MDSPTTFGRKFSIHQEKNPSGNQGDIQHKQSGRYMAGLSLFSLDTTEFSTLDCLCQIVCAGLSTPDCRCWLWGRFSPGYPLNVHQIVCRASGRSKYGNRGFGNGTGLGQDRAGIGTGQAMIGIPAQYRNEELWQVPEADVVLSLSSDLSSLVVRDRQSGNKLNQIQAQVKGQHSKNVQSLNI